MRLYLYYSLLALVLFSCNDPQSAAKQDESTSSDEKKQDYWSANNCLRSIPEKTLDSTLLTTYTFELLKDKGIETASWSNGDSLVVINDGCELYWFAYTYIIRNYDKNATNLDLIMHCFQQVQEVDIAPIDFKGALEMVAKIKEGGGQINTGREYFLKVDRVAEMFEIDEIDLKKEYAVVKFSFAIGHL